MNKDKLKLLLSYGVIDLTYMKTIRSVCKDALGP